MTKENNTDTVLTLKELLAIFAAVVAVWGFLKAVKEIIKAINDRHDQEQKWNEYGQQIDIKHTETENRLAELETDSEAKLQELRVNVELLMAAVQMSLRKDLSEAFRKYQAQGYIEQDDLDWWSKTYEAYHGLGQNGVMDTRNSQVMKFKVVENGYEKY